MTDQVQISIDREVYELLEKLMVPPISDPNAVIRELLIQDGRASPAAVAVEAGERHFTMEQELERANSGVYDSGGST